MYSLIVCLIVAEEGKFLALDLGGTNFRVLLIELHGSDFKMDNEIYPVPQHIMLGTGEQVMMQML